VTTRQPPARDTEAVILDTATTLYIRACDDPDARDLDPTSQLGEAIQAYDLIHSGTIHPAAYWDDLTDWHDPYDAGLQRAAAITMLRIGALIEQAPWLIGDPI
jgi:hypothetical protein